MKGKDTDKEADDQGFFLNSSFIMNPWFRSNENQKEQVTTSQFFPSLAKKQL